MSDNLADWLSAFSAFCSVIVAALSLGITYKINKESIKLAQQANYLVEKQSRTEKEMELRRNITAAFNQEHSASWDVQQAVIHFMKEKGSSLPKSKRERALLNDPEYKLRMSILYAAQENVRNAYEEACDIYLHREVDQYRFESEYRSDIKKLVESRQHKSHYYPYSIEFPSTSKVYKHWFPSVADS